MFKSIDRPTVKKYLPLILFIYLPPIILLIIVGVIAGFTDISLEDFLEDPAQLVGYDSYLGLINNLGIALWASAVAVCIFTYIALRRMGKSKDISKFVLFFGLFTLILFFDDLFLIHEWLANYFSEFIIPLAFVIIFILLLFRFRATILNTNYLFLVIAILFFGISLVFDVIQSLKIFLFLEGIAPLFEDGSKFLGIISWLTYFARVGLTSLRSKDID